MVLRNAGNHGKTTRRHNQVTAIDVFICMKPKIFYFFVFNLSATLLSLDIPYHSYLLNYLRNGICEQT
jgi:hypothetical protein